MKGALHVSLRNLMEKITPSASKGFPLVEYFLLLGEQHKLPVGQHKLLGEQHKLLGWQHKIHHHHSTFSSSLALAFCRACSSSAKSERVPLCSRFLCSAGAQASKLVVFSYPSESVFGNQPFRAKCLGEGFYFDSFGI